MKQKDLAKLYEIPLTLKTRKETTGKKELEEMFLKTGDRILEKVLEIRSLDTNLNNYLPNWKPKSDGRVHTTWGFTAPSGQKDSRQPNILNCFSSDTEILTMRGWVKFPELTKEDEVAQYDTEFEVIDFIKPLEYIEQEGLTELLHIHTEEQIDILCTTDHECLLQDRKTDRYFKVPASEYKEDCRQLQAGTYYDGTLNYTESQIALSCALQADGHMVLVERQVRPSIQFIFYKDRKIERLRWALQQEGIPFRETEVKRTTGFNPTLLTGVSFYIGANNVPDWLIDKKYFDSWILELDRESLDYFVNEIFFWDGSWTVKNQYATCKKSNADFVQAAFVLSNVRANMIGWQPKEVNRQVSWQVLVGSNYYSMTTNVRKELVKYSGKVYCVTVPTGNIIVRRNNKVAITGNCSKHTAIGQLFRGIVEAPEGYTFVEGDKKSFHVATMGYAAEDRDYIRFSQLDPHSIFTSHIMPKDWGKPIDMSWSDEDILARCKEIKKRSKGEREKDPIHGVDIRQDIAKPTVLGNQLGLGARKLYWMNRRFINGIREAERLQGILGELFPKVSKFKDYIRDKAHQQTYLILPEWGKIQYFFDVYSFVYNKRFGKWDKRSGTDSEKAIAFPVQGYAFGMIDQELIRIALNGGCRRYNFLLGIHDSLIFMPKVTELDKCIEMIVTEMGKPCKELRNKVTGDGGLQVAVEIAVGRNWKGYDKETNKDGMQEIKI